jgi:hypothetical protein
VRSPSRSLSPLARRMGPTAGGCCGSWEPRGPRRGQGHAAGRGPWPGGAGRREQLPVVPSPDPFSSPGRPTVYARTAAVSSSFFELPNFSSARSSFTLFLFRRQFFHTLLLDGSSRLFSSAPSRSLPLPPAPSCRRPVPHPRSRSFDTGCVGGIWSGMAHGSNLPEPTRHKHSMPLPVPVRAFVYARVRARRAGEGGEKQTRRKRLSQMLQNYYPYLATVQWCSFF